MSEKTGHRIVESLQIPRDAARYGFALLGVTLAALAAGAKPAGASEESLAVRGASTELTTGASFDYTALPRSTVDRPDDFSGPQFHVFYATCKKPDGTTSDRSLDISGGTGAASFIDKSLGRIESFYFSRSGEVARIDMYHNSPDITYLPTNMPCDQVSSYPGFPSTARGVNNALDRIIPSSNIYLPSKVKANTIALVYMDDDQVKEGCGASYHIPEEQGRTASVYFAVNECAPYTDNIMAYNLLQSNGLPHANSPHATFGGGGVSDDTKDLAFFKPAFPDQPHPTPGIFSGPLENLNLDIARDDYWNDLTGADPYFGEPSAWKPPTPKNGSLEINETGHGKVVATIKGIGSRVCSSLVRVKKCVFPNFVPPNKMISLTETPAVHYRFGGWSDNRMERTRTLSGTSLNRRIGAKFLQITAQK